MLWDSGTQFQSNDQLTIKNANGRKITYSIPNSPFYSIESLYMTMEIASPKIGHLYLGGHFISLILKKIGVKRPKTPSKQHPL